MIHMAQIMRWKGDDLPGYLQKRKKVLVGGCFDIFHFGHLIFLQKAKETGEILIVALESDEFIRKKKKRKPIHTHMQRANILASLRMIDVVILLPYFATDEQYFQLVKTLKPEVLAITRGDRLLKKKQKQAAMIGAQLKIVTPLLKDFASSRFIRYASLFSN